MPKVAVIILIFDYYFLKQLVLEASYLHGYRWLVVVPLYFEESKILFYNHVSYSELICFGSAASDMSHAA